MEQAVSYLTLEIIKIVYVCQLLLVSYTAGEYVESYASTLSLFSGRWSDTDPHIPIQIVEDCLRIGKLNLK